MTNLALNIEKNPRTGGFCCDFIFKGKGYFADKSYVPFLGSETMIFAKEDDGSIDWEELYTDRTGKSLRVCIYEFCRTL